LPITRSVLVIAALFPAFEEQTFSFLDDGILGGGA
jgi:hypothetical protein